MLNFLIPFDLIVLQKYFVKSMYELCWNSSFHEINSSKRLLHHVLISIPSFSRKIRHLKALFNIALCGNLKNLLSPKFFCQIN